MAGNLTLDIRRKICSLARLGELAGQHRAGGRRIVLCHGCFDIVHPGHVRYLQFARGQGDVLVVSLTGDASIEKSDGSRPYIPQELRAENLAALEFVDHVAIVDGATAEPVLRALRPDVYVKGREYEQSTHPGFLAEKALVEAAGGRVIFSSGEVVFSSTALVDSLARAPKGDGLDESFRLGACCERWGLGVASLRRLIGEGFAGKRVAVVGDAMADRYVFCDATSVAGEAPVLSVRPLEEATYLGGAAILAAHLRALGASCHLVTTVAEDATSATILEELDRRGVEHHTFATRRALPLKIRYLVETQKLLKVDQAQSQPLDSTTQREMMGTLAELRTSLDAVIFCDFGYGTVTHALLAEALPLLRPHVGVLAGGISGIQRTLLAFREFDLLVPNERELRGVVGDFDESLPTLAFRLMRQLQAGNLAVTMGPRGCVLFRPRETDRAQWFESRLLSDYLPSLAKYAVDPLGAGDAFLSAATLALSAGATLPQAGYVGSAAAAIAVSRVGNHAVAANDLLQWLVQRPELAPARRADVG